MAKNFAPSKANKGGKRFFKKSEETPIAPKRKCEDDENLSSEESTDQINLLLQEFGGNMQRNLQSKQKKMKQEIEDSVQVAFNEMAETFRTKSEEHQQLMIEFRAKLEGFLEQELSNLQKEQDAKGQLQKAMKQRDKELSQLMVEKNERLTTMKTLAGIFFQGVEDLSQSHDEQRVEMFTEIEGNVKNIHKKLQANIEQEVMSKLRKNLKSLFD